ncbi:MAG: ChbG/HpnK family deacetylase [Pseudomonadota bacterium]
METPPDEFILCADDYAQSAAIDAGILQLLRQRRLTAVSCLVESPRWPAAAGALQEFTGQADFGLHLNFTQAFGDAPVWPLPALMARAWLHRLPPALLEQRIAAQIERFRRHMGRLPDFIDGHRHVHQLPQIRSALLRQIAHYWKDLPPPWVRLTVPRRFRGWKAALIAALGGRSLARKLQRAGIPGNPDFAGVYALQPGMFYRPLMQIWLQGLAPGGLLMTHPGTEGDTDDALADVRPQELAYLASAAFLQDCRAAGKTVARFRRGL